ncbi:MAG TPA: immunoglobulin domain-containing protein [Opitutaceae bacterium]|nr:immunoglobulin domain-containing protein [Opitutaceae bacterium]
MYRRLLVPLFVLVFTVGAFGQQRAWLAGVNGRVYLDTEGAWMFVTIDPSGGARSVLITASGPGLKPFGVNGTVSDPQFEIWDQSGTRITANDNRDDALLNVSGYPITAHDPKDAGLQITLGPGTYAIHVTGVGGATGVCLVGAYDGGANPTISSFAVRGRTDSTGIVFGATLWGTGNISLASFLSGPNLPVTNPVVDPALVIDSGPQVISTVTDVQGGVAATMPKYRSPVVGDVHNAGKTLLWTYDTSNPGAQYPPEFQISGHGSTTAYGTYLFELHDDDFTATRPAVTYVLPTNVVVNEGDPLTVRALVGGEVDSVIWQRNGVDIPGSTSGLVVSAAMTLTYTKPAAALGDAGTYRLHMTTVGGATVYSPPTTVYVQQVPPSLTTQPQSVTVTTGSTVTLSVTATGSNLTYQWHKNGMVLPGATSATLTIPTSTAADAGNYWVEVSNSLGFMDSYLAIVTVQEPTRLTNLSVRSFSGTGDRILTVGFALSGAGKPLLVRAVGPSLAPYGVTDFMTDPRLTVFENSTAILSNDDWSGDDGRTLGAFQLPAGSKDAVVRNAFSGRNYTAQVDSSTGGTGEALVELYDADISSTATQLVNISSRTQLDDGQRLIVGMTLTGQASKGLVMRAVGPGLLGFDVTTAHPDPQIELYDSNSVKIASNDNWSRDDGESAGAFPLTVGSKDAVLVKTLPPGQYTLQVFGAPGTSGIVLVEVYAAP